MIASVEFHRSMKESHFIPLRTTYRGDRDPGCNLCGAGFSTRFNSGDVRGDTGTLCWWSVVELVSVVDDPLPVVAMVTGVQDFEPDAIAAFAFSSASFVARCSRSSSSNDFDLACTARLKDRACVYKVKKCCSLWDTDILEADLINYFFKYIM